MSELDPKSPIRNSPGMSSKEVTPRKTKSRLRKKSSFYEKSRTTPAKPQIFELGALRESQPDLPPLKLNKYDSLASQIVDSQSADSDDKLLASKIEELQIKKNKTVTIRKRLSLKNTVPDSPMFDHFKFKPINVNPKASKFLNHIPALHLYLTPIQLKRKKARLTKTLRISINCSTQKEVKIQITPSMLFQVSTQCQTKTWYLLGTLRMNSCLWTTRKASRFPRDREWI